MTDKQRLIDQLAPFGQEHILTFWDELDEKQRDRLARQIEALDLQQLQELFERRALPPASAALAYRAKEPKAFCLSDQRERLDAVDDQKYRQWPIVPSEAIRAGDEALRLGKIAVAVVAGGQGTRLDFPHAKGIYPIGPISQVTLFQIHIERIRAMARKYSVRIPFCIQTSPATHEETIEFFQKNHNFGLADEDVFIFCQGTMPSLDAQTGKLYLSAPDSITVSPDGHGGFLAAINAPVEDRREIVAKEGILAELQRRGIEELFYFQIDNPLIDICSPEFIGYHLLSHSEFSSQVIRKKEPLDRVGNMVMVDDQLYVIEYSDLPEDVGRRRKSDGSLEIWAGSIAVHLMNIDFLRKSASYADSLPFHIAKKKLPHIVLDHDQLDSQGNSLYGKYYKPEGTNGIKFEKFIFDLLPLAKNPIVVEIDAATGFEPLKNNTNQPKDNPQTVRRQLCALYQKWLAAMNITLDPDVCVEISPLFANSARELKTRLEEKELVPADRRITQSGYWSLDEDPSNA